MSSQPLPPPAWHDDPSDATSLRYWDGAQWTENRAPKVARPAKAQPGRTNSDWPPARLAAIGGAAAIIVGSFSPWVTVVTVFGSISFSGTHSGGDGLFSLAGGAVIGVLVATSKYLAAIIVSMLTGALLLYDLVNVNRHVGGADSEFAAVSVGWGLWLAAAGAVVAFGTSIHLNRLNMQANKPGASWSAPAVS